MRILIAVFQNIFTMFLFGMLEGLWMLFGGLWIAAFIFNFMSVFWVIWWCFWGIMIITNAIYNRDFWQ